MTFQWVPLPYVAKCVYPSLQGTQLTLKCSMAVGRISPHSNRLQEQEIPHKALIIFHTRHWTFVEWSKGHKMHSGAPCTHFIAPRAWQLVLGNGDSIFFNMSTNVFHVCTQTSLRNSNRDIGLCSVNLSPTLHY